MRSAAGPIKAASRSFISLAALLVNVIARIWLGYAPHWLRAHAIRLVRTRVLPDPAPAAIRSAGPSYCTACDCCSLSPLRRYAASRRTTSWSGASGTAAPAVCAGKPSKGPFTGIFLHPTHYASAAVPLEPHYIYRPVIYLTIYHNATYLFTTCTAYGIKLASRQLPSVCPEYGRFAA